MEYLKEFFAVAVAVFGVFHSAGFLLSTLSEFVIGDLDEDITDSWPPTQDLSHVPFSPSIQTDIRPNR